MGRTKTIPGASFIKETVGGRWHYWRARVGKKLTGDKPILRDCRRSFSGPAAAFVSSAALRETCPARAPNRRPA